MSLSSYIRWKTSVRNIRKNKQKGEKNGRGELS